MEESRFRAGVVWLVVNGQAERALERLADRYRVGVPRLRVGLPKGRRRNVLGCYVARSNTICVVNGDVLRDPFVILHEFYHCLRTGVDVRHRGTERYANEFAMEFIEAYKAVMVR